MRELLILILIGAVAYLAYDDYYKQRPALEQAQADVQQLREKQLAATPRPVTQVRRLGFKTWTKALAEMSRQHTRQGEKQAPPPANCRGRGTRP
jgi:hypothetical protein